MDVYVDTPRWLLKADPRPGCPRLYCFPHGGGSAAEYVSWARAATGIEVCAIQLPGRGRRFREPSFTGMDELVAAVIDKIPFGSHGRFAFFGHSLGALVAYEVTRLLWARGRTLPDRLVVSGNRAPSLQPRQRVSRLRSDDELLDDIALRHGGVPAGSFDDPEVRSLVLGPLRADHTILSTYRWRHTEPLPVPVTVFGARDDHVRVDELHAWQRHTTEPLALRLFPGGHFYLREQTTAVLHAITETLAASRPAAA